jgi:Uncharacterised protein family (UPF0236)
VELNRALGTLGDEAKEQQLAALIHRIESMPGCIRDYREWLKEQGVDTTGMYPMGRAESVRSQLAYRVKYRRSWTDKGLGAFFKAMIARYGWDSSFRTSFRRRIVAAGGGNGVDDIHQTDDREQGETTRPPSLAGDHVE